MRRIAASAVALSVMLAMAGCASQEVAPRAAETPVFKVTDTMYVPKAEEAGTQTPLPAEEPEAEDPEPSLNEEQEPEPSLNGEPVAYADPGADWYGEVNGHPTRYEFSAMGVLRDGTFTYCWYSSNASYHADTWQWHTDSEGYWRTEDGYLVVASSDYPEGTELVTDMFGRMRVLDTGCAHGVIDVYVSW